MSNIDMHDIGDDEIRIISCNQAQQKNTSPTVPPSRKGKHRIIFFCVLLGILAFIGTLVGLFFPTETSQPISGKEEQPTPSFTTSSPVSPDSLQSSLPYVEKLDTTIHHVALVVFSPQHATPSLSIGPDVLSDSAAIMVTPAADVREDNEEIVGAYVLAGDLVGKGKSKAGFCAIIHGVPTIGVADATPLLEQALETNGYFFRQYPLVVSHQVVENKPKGRALRKALAQWGEKTVVIISRDRLTFHDFSQALVDLGVSNAIYLVGSNTYGFARHADGSKTEFGASSMPTSPNSNYLVWR